MMPIAVKSKYGNKKVMYMGITFDSKKEFERFLFLRDQQKQGKISELDCHVKFPLIEAFKHRGITILGASYEADFVYKIGSDVVVEDVKSIATKSNPLYILKKKLLLSINPNMDFREII